jgi:AcrR family transcriptional regulator
MRTLDPQKNLAQRRKILEKSCTLFALKGFAETTMSAIGRACKLTKPALYHYFKSKEEILSGLFEDTWLSTQEQISKLPKVTNLKELLMVAGRTYLEHMEEPRNIELCKITLKESAQHALVRQQSLSFVRPKMEKHILSVFGPYVRKGTPEKEIRLFACQFFGSLFYYAFVDKIMGEGQRLPASRERYLESLVEIFSKQAA